MLFNVRINLSATTDFPSLYVVCWIHFNIVYSQKSFKKIFLKSTTLINPYFIWFSSFRDSFLKCINNTTSFFVFLRNNPCVFTLQINFAQEILDSFVVFAQWLHISYVNTSNIVSKRWINFSCLKFFNNLLMKFINKPYQAHFM